MLRFSSIPSSCFYFFLFLFSIVTIPSHGDGDLLSDTLHQGQYLNYLDVLYSANKAFKLQFFSSKLGYYYLCVFYNSGGKTDYATLPGSRTTSNTPPVWVANRDDPILDSTLWYYNTALVIDADGLLKITHINFLVANTSKTTNGSVEATLLDNGNFVLRRLNSEGSINKTLWQSFDYPTDTPLPGMKLGINLRTGQETSLISWLSSHAPGKGSFTLGIDPNGTDQLILWWRGKVYWTSGLWRNGRFDNMNSFGPYNFSYVSNEDEKYFSYSLNYNLSAATLSMTPQGMIKGEGGQIDFNYCYMPQPEGCVREDLPTCEARGQGFSFQRVDLFGHNNYRSGENSNLTLFDCQAKCLGSCSCVAFGSTSLDGPGCEIWNRVRVRKGNRAYARVLYILHPGERGANWTKKWGIRFVVVAVTTIALLSSIAILVCFVRRRKIKEKGKIEAIEKVFKHVQVDKSMHPTKLPAKIIGKIVWLFTWEDILKATNNFDDARKLGQGGFGPVYKGELTCGQEVAIKRLSRESGQGLVEFQNEVQLIAKLQHTNLVSLLGSCIQRQERILVYEYMPNKSLDHFLFDPKRGCMLKLKHRMTIIEGIARGLLYLHKDSRLKVIHRDIKAGNILLDHNMNPKISDFGMARIFEVQEYEVNTKKIVGTRGYMSPEYIINGVVSTKTDVFSFGVLLLEIVSGKRNRASYDDVRPLNLIGLAWELWIDGRAMELVDSSLDDVFKYKEEVTRCIHTGLLCVQNCSTVRPSMEDVVFMLKHEHMQLPAPEPPAFFLDMSKQQMLNELQLEMKPCTNGLTTSLDAR